MSAKGRADVIKMKNTAVKTKLERAKACSAGQKKTQTLTGDISEIEQAVQNFPVLKKPPKIPDSSRKCWTNLFTSCEENGMQMENSHPVGVDLHPK